MFELVARVATNWITMFKFTLKMMYEHTFFYLIKVNGVWRIIDSAREKKRQWHQTTAIENRISSLCGRNNSIWITAHGPRG